MCSNANITYQNERKGDIMALRKEDFDYEDTPVETPKKRSRITIDVSPEMRRRIKLAALQNDLTVGEYVGRILEENVPTEVNREQQRRPITREAIEGLRQIREQIMQDRNGRLFEDSAELIRQMREERSQELEQL